MVKVLNKNIEIQNVEMIENVLLIDENVKSYENVVNSCNDKTFCYIYSKKQSYTEILDLLKKKFLNVKRLGLFFSYEKNYRFLNNNLLVSNNSANFFINLIKDLSIINLDFLACDTLLNLNWKTFYSYLEKETGIKIGASDNKTGNIKYGGDWIMESSLEDIQNIYFNKDIQYYKYLLDDSYSTVFIKDGLLYGCGDNWDGQLGFVGQPVIMLLKNIPLPPGKLPLNVSYGRYHTIVHMTDGSVYGCGDNSDGQLGLLEYKTLRDQINTYETTYPYNVGASEEQILNYNQWINRLDELEDEIYVLSEMYIPEGKTVGNISCGTYHTIVHMTDGSVYGCGENWDGQLGLSGVSEIITQINNIYETSEWWHNPDLWAELDRLERLYANIWNLTEMYIPEGKTVGNISCGRYHTIVHMTDGSVYGCGDNSDGQLGLLEYKTLRDQINTYEITYPNNAGATEEQILNYNQWINRLYELDDEIYVLSEMYIPVTFNEFSSSDIQNYLAQFSSNTVIEDSTISVKIDSESISSKVYVCTSDLSDENSTITYEEAIFKFNPSTINSIGKINSEFQPTLYSQLTNNLSMSDTVVGAYDIFSTGSVEVTFQLLENMNFIKAKHFNNGLIETISGIRSDNSVTFNLRYSFSPFIFYGGQEITTGGDPIINPLYGPKFSLANHIKYVNLLADYSNKIFINARVDMLLEKDFPKTIYWDNSFCLTSNLSHIYNNSYYREFYIYYDGEAVKINADTLDIIKLTSTNKIKVANFQQRNGLKSISFSKTYPLLNSTKGLKIGLKNYLLTFISDINTDDRHHIELLAVKNKDLENCSGALICKDQILKICSLEGKELFEFNSNPFNNLKL